VTQFSHSANTGGLLGSAGITGTLNRSIATVLSVLTRKRGNLDVAPLRASLGLDLS
jgi:hypothetical protein